MRSGFLLVLALIGVLAWVAPASGASRVSGQANAAQAVYNVPAPAVPERAVAGEEASGGGDRNRAVRDAERGASASPTQIAGLPFTGSSALAVLGLGLGLLTGGLLLRRRAESTS
jgi:hypothetical protein